MEAGSVRLLAALFVLFEFFVLSWESPRRSREKEITEFCVNPSDGDVIWGCGRKVGPSRAVGLEFACIAKRT